MGLFRRFLTVLAIGTLLLLAACDDQGKEANALFSKAATAYREGLAAEAPSARVGAFHRALDLLDQLVERYPETDLAVTLSSGQAVGEVSLAAVSDSLTRAIRDREIETVAKAPQVCLDAPTPLCLTDLGLSMVEDPDITPFDRTYALVRAAEALGVMGEEADYAATLDTLSELIPQLEGDDRDYAEELMVDVFAAGGRGTDRQKLIATLEEEGRGYDQASIAKYLAVNGDRAALGADVEDVLDLIEEETSTEDTPYVFTAIDVLELCRSRPFLNKRDLSEETWDALAYLTGMIPRLLIALDRTEDLDAADRTYGALYYRLAAVQCAAADGNDMAEALLRDTLAYFETNKEVLDDLDQTSFVEDSIVTQWTLGDRDGALARVDLTEASIDNAIILFRLATYLVLEDGGSSRL
ncbi:MAG: hypothetical protein K9H25_05175 [Rhodospirillum sp.]|nr:hypothetical protein [Rhodospirillum sp.]MCF8490899.1 hypothetical protein [Rhodospirillum sp.]MCF8499923.1 hypothetical protein [Rhodospirillum sp.]